MCCLDVVCKRKFGVWLRPIRSSVCYLTNLGLHMASSSDDLHLSVSEQHTIENGIHASYLNTLRIDDLWEETN